MTTKYLLYLILALCHGSLTGILHLLLSLATAAGASPAATAVLLQVHCGQVTALQSRVRTLIPEQVPCPLEQPFGGDILKDELDVADTEA